MILFLCAQDLQTCWIGLIEQDEFTVLEEHLVAPEQHLQTLNDFFVQHQMSPNQLSGISVVAGPGSFTSSRVSLTIANTLHFIHQIPLFVLENLEKQTPMDLLKTNGIGQLLDKDVYAHAVYNRPPHTT